MWPAGRLCSPRQPTVLSVLQGGERHSRVFCGTIRKNLISTVKIALFRRPLCLAMLTVLLPPFAIFCFENNSSNLAGRTSRSFMLWRGGSDQALKLEDVPTTAIWRTGRNTKSRPHPQGFWNGSSGLGPRNPHFSRTPRELCGCWPGNRTRRQRNAAGILWGELDSSSRQYGG